MGDNGKRTTHGKVWFYTKYKCHCAECRMAKADYMMKWRAERAAAREAREREVVEMMNRE